MSIIFRTFDETPPHIVILKYGLLVQGFYFGFYWKSRIQVMYVAGWRIPINFIPFIGVFFIVG